ncbi:hypothetical protein [Paenibacillus sp. TH7-28]
MENDLFDLVARAHNGDKDALTRIFAGNWLKMSIKIDTTGNWVVFLFLYGNF